MCRYRAGPQKGQDQKSGLAQTWMQGRVSCQGGVIKYCVGTFGVSSAAILWTRLFGCVGRWVLWILGPRWNLQVIFVDDLHIVVIGADKYVVLWMILAAYLAIGAPFSFHKFKGGLVAEFIGHYLSYETFSAGLFTKTGQVGSGVGRLNFVARLLNWIRPFLAPLFAFNAVLRRAL